MPAHRAFIALSLGAVLIGLAPIFVRLADVGPAAAAFWRCLLAWPVFALALRVTSMRRGAIGPRPAAAHTRPHGLLILAGLFFAADLALWHYAIEHTSVANATLLANLAPLFVAPAAWLLWRESISRRFALGMALALAGTLVLVGRSAQLDFGGLAGDALAICAALFYAGYILTITHLRRGVDALRVMTWSSATVAAVLLPVAWLMGERIWPGSAQGWAVLAGLALLSHVGGQGLIAHSMAGVPAALSAVGLLLQPLAATLFAWWLLAEGFGPAQALGGVVILAGILLCRGASRPASQKDALAA